MASTLGMFHLSNSTPQSRSIQGKAFSWPTATNTSSQLIVSSASPDGTRLRRPLASYSAFTFWKVTPVSLPLSWTKATGTMKLRIGMSSWRASSFSQGEAFISSKPERTITLTSSPPSRRAVRQQSIAVLPPPSTMTRLPILLTCSNETEASHSMPMWILRGGFLAAGNFELAAARRAGADKHRVEVLGEQLLQAVDAVAAFELDAEIEDVVGFLVDHRIRQPEFRNLRPHHAAGLGVGIEHGAVIAERREVAGHRQRGGAAADDRDALAVLRRQLRHAVL